MAQYSAALLDDDTAALEMLGSELKTAFEAIGHTVVLHPFTEPGELISHLSARTPDFLFLDIALGRSDGITLGKQIRTMRYDGLIIYVSGHSEHVFASLQINPFRFIRKTRLREELPEAVAAGLQRLSGRTGRKAVLRNTKAALQVDVDKLLYIESHSKTLELVMTDGTRYFDCRISDAEQLLRPFGVLRVHKGYLVNSRRLEYLDRENAILEGGIRIPVSKTRRAEAEQQYLALLRQELTAEGGGFL